MRNGRDLGLVGRVNQVGTGVLDGKAASTDFFGGTIKVIRYIAVVWTVRRYLPGGADFC